MAIDWNRLGEGLINAGTGYYLANQGSNAASAGVNIAADAAAQRRAAYNAYASQLAGLAPSVNAAYRPVGGTVRTALATGVTNPATGEVTNTLDPRAAGLFSKYLQGAESAIGQAGNFDPRALGQERLNAQLALLAPQRAAQDAQLYRTLQAKGLLGTGTYTPGVPGSEAANPYFAAMQGARAQADAALAARSLDEGENYLDRLLKRSAGLFGGAQTVSDAGARTGAASADFARQLTSDNRLANAATTGLFKDAYQAQLNAGLPSADYSRALAEQARADAIRRGSTASSGAGLFTDVLRGMGGVSNLGNIFSKGKDWFSGIFNTSYNTSPVDGFFVGPAYSAEMTDAWI